MSLSLQERFYRFVENFSLANNNLFDPPNEQHRTRTDQIEIGGTTVPRFANEFWTSKQRQASSLHEISYRACFKPQLPRFFINLFTKDSDLVYDPFSGRGTTVVEAALLGHEIIANDINPLSEILTKPRLTIPNIQLVQQRLQQIPKNSSVNPDLDFSMFYHPDTLSELNALRNYLQNRRESRKEDYIDQWIRMVATNRLTGHSQGFFSVYTLPPNQAVSPTSQLKINQQRNQLPPYRDTHYLILKKTRSLLQNITTHQRRMLSISGQSAKFLTRDARQTKEIESNSIQLTVTSPPFLDIVQYSKDNWLRCWFNGIDVKAIEKKMTLPKSLSSWTEIMQEVFCELYRITKPKGWLAFEVGEIKKKSIQLDEIVVPLGIKVGFSCIGILINLQNFTKTANIWGVANNTQGTNTNRIVLFRK
jgi:DNA modification methylase